MRFFFLGGAPKSGTTWMQKAIDAHPHAVCSGEGHFHGLIVKPMLELFRTYNEKLASVNQIVYGDQPYYRSLRQPEVLGIIKQTIVALMSRRASEKTLALGDKTPAYASVIRDLNMIFPEMLFVLMVRDPRDMAASRLFQIERTQGTKVLDQASDAYREAVKEAAEAWVVAHERCRSFAADSPQRLLTVRYEDFLEAPVTVLSRVFAFLELPTDSMEIERIAALTSFEGLSGRKNGEEDRTSFYRKGIKGDWPNVLDTWAVETIASSCGRGMEEMGYLR